MKKRFLGLLSMVMLLLVGVVGCSTGNAEGKNATNEENKTVVVTDQKGEVEVPVNPKNVVVLDLGSLKEFDLEKINEVEPDLIIIEGRQESYYEDLKKIAPVLYLGTANSDIFASAENNAKVLGKVFDKEEGVIAELENINKRLEAVNAKVKEGNFTALMTMFNEGSLSVYGEGSRYDMVYSKFGFTPADTQIEASTHGQNISFEYLKEKNPDYLLVLDRGAITGAQASVKETVENELIKTTKAYEKGHIVYVNPQAWYVGGSGIMAIDTIISDIEKAVHIK